MPSSGGEIPTRKIQTKVTNEDVARAAYYLYQDRQQGRRSGNAKEDWFMAEQQLLTTRSVSL